MTVTVFNADTIPPTVSMTAPANNAAVAERSTFRPARLDASGVVGVQFCSMAPRSGAEDTVAPWNRLVRPASPTAPTLAARRFLTRPPIRRRRPRSCHDRKRRTVRRRHRFHGYIVRLRRSRRRHSQRHRAANRCSVCRSDKPDWRNNLTGVTGGSLTWQLVDARTRNLVRPRFGRSR